MQIQTPNTDSRASGGWGQEGIPGEMADSRTGVGNVQDGPYAGKCSGKDGNMARGYRNQPEWVPTG